MSKYKNTVLFSLLLCAIALLIGVQDTNKFLNPPPPSKYIKINRISWDQAKADIDTGTVHRAYLLPASRIVVLEVGNSYLQFTEPANLSTHQEVLKCGSACQGIQFSLVRRLIFLN